MTRSPAPVQWLLATGAVVGATGACFWLDGRMSVAGLAMVYLVAVAVTAVALERAPAMAASLACVCALNFFFVPPRLTFEVDSAEYWWILAVLLGLSAVLHGLIASLRERSERAERGESRAAQLHSLSEALAQCVGHQAMAQRAAEWLRDALGLPCTIFLLGADGHTLDCWCAGGTECDFQPSAVRWAIEHGRALGRGCDDWGDLPLWCAPFARSGATGALQLLMADRPRPTTDEQQHWLALVRQAGASVERERSIVLAQAASDSAGAESARNTLLASLSHDLRTPLATILGSASALRTQGEAMPALQRDMLLLNLENEARDMTLMTDNILQMARLSQPKWQLRTEWESVEDVLGAALERMRRRWPHARFELQVTAHLQPLRAEAGLLAQLVANLVDNAVRHGGQQPQVTIRAGRSRNGIFIAVRDHGSGLPPGDPQALFNRFGQGERDGASGLGLAICRLIAQAHGGQIDVRRCEPGAEFRIDLPAAQGGPAHG